VTESRPAEARAGRAGTSASLIARSPRLGDLRTRRRGDRHNAGTERRLAPSTAWSQSFDSEAGAPFELLDQIAERLNAAMAEALPQGA